MKWHAVLLATGLFGTAQVAEACTPARPSISDRVRKADLVVVGSANLSKARQEARIYAKKVIKGSRRQHYDVTIDYQTHFRKRCGLKQFPQGNVKGTFFLRIQKGELQITHFEVGAI